MQHNFQRRPNIQSVDMSSISILLKFVFICSARRFFFSRRVVNEWNSLPAEVVRKELIQIGPFLRQHFLRTINDFLNDPKYKGILALLKGVRNGVVYGAKIRAPHALVMVFLFKSGSFSSKIKTILQLTYEHSKNLGTFVFIYKTLKLVLASVQEKREYQSFIAAFIGGYYVFGKNTKVNHQINLYLLSRILVGLGSLAIKENIVPRPKYDIFPWFGAVVWGVVLWLFEHHRDTLQDSLRASMVYLYDDSEKWSNVEDFLLYNSPGTV